MRFASVIMKSRQSHGMVTAAGVRAVEAEIPTLGTLHNQVAM